MFVKVIFQIYIYLNLALLKMVSAYPLEINIVNYCMKQNETCIGMDAI